MKKSLLATLILVSIQLIPLTVKAGDLMTITNRTGSCSSTSICDIFAGILNTLIPDAQTVNFLPGMADATILANKGLATDYGSNVEVMSLGAGVGIGLDPGESGGSGTGDGNATLPAIGIGGTIGLGVNMGLFLKGKFWDRSTAYVNFFSYELTTGSVKGELSSIGFHYQFKLLTPMDFAAGVVRWGGIDITTGLQIASTKITTTVPINQSYNDGTNTAAYNGIATIGADISSTSIPIEVTTNIRLLYALSAYFGLGMDINSGSSKAIANTTGGISVTGALAGTGDATLDLGTESSPSSTSFRTIAGLQLNVTALRVFIQTMSVIGENDKNISLGVRLAW